MRRGRPWRVAIIGLLVAAVAGTSSVIATALARRADLPPPLPAATLYFPDGGLGQGARSQSGGSAVGGAAPGVSSDSAAALALPHQGSGDVASALGGTIAFPGGGWCTGAAQLSGRTVTATGMSQLLGSALGATTTMLRATVSENGTGDTSHEVSAVQARLSAVIDALSGVGVPRSSIHASGVSVYANTQRGGVVPQPATSSGAVSSVHATAALTATLSDAGVVDRAVGAAARAGADSVNASTQAAAAVQPSPAAIAGAIAQATDEAKQLASASAKAAGVTLGTLSALTTQPPAICGYGQEGARLVVAVTAAWDLK